MAFFNVLKRLFFNYISTAGITSPGFPNILSVLIQGVGSSSVAIARLWPRKKVPVSCVFPQMTRRDRFGQLSTHSPRASSETLVLKEMSRDLNERAECRPSATIGASVKAGSPERFTRASWPPRARATIRARIDRDVAPFNRFKDNSCSPQSVNDDDDDDDARR